MINNTTATAAGTTPAHIKMCQITTAHSGGTAITPYNNDTGDTSVDLTSITCAQSAFTSGTKGADFATFVRATPFHAAAQGTTTSRWAEISTITNENCMWDLGYGDADCQPITCRQNQGICIYTSASSPTVASAAVDIFVDFTVE